MKQMVFVVAASLSGTAAGIGRLPPLSVASFGEKEECSDVRWCPCCVSWKAMT